MFDHQIRTYSYTSALCLDSDTDTRRPAVGVQAGREREVWCGARCVMKAVPQDY